MKNTAGFAKRLGCETPKERNRQHIFNKEGDRSLPKIN